MKSGATNEGGIPAPGPVATGRPATGAPTPGAMAWLFLFCTIWGVNMVAIKVSNPGLAPVTASALRSSAVSLLLMGWMAFRGIPLFRPGRTFFWGVLAGALFAGEFLFLYLGLSYTTASRGMILLYTAPFFMAAGAHFLLPGDRLTPRKGLGLAAAFLGTASVLGEHALSFDPATLRGDLLCLTAGLFWGGLTLVIKGGLAPRVTALESFHYQITYSAPFLVVTALLMEPHPVREFTSLTAGSLAFQVLVVCLASYLGWQLLVYRFSLGRLSPFLFAAPIMGVLSGALLMGDPLPATLLFGLAGVGAGIWLVNR
jgi:drug/metabolite transporter (DMT)-like permease